MPMSPPSTTKLKIQISSLPENIVQIEPFMEKVRQRYNLNDRQYFNMLLVLTEAVNNSILHGNQSDPQKKVIVQFCAKSQQFEFVVTDEGQGFDPTIVADPTTPDHVECPNGRGVFLIRKYSDYVRYSDNGRKLQICFNCLQDA